MEALQLADLPQIMEHISFVLDCLRMGRGLPSYFELRQETLIFSYVSAIFKAIEEINESQIVTLARDLRLPMLLMDVLLDHSASLPAIVQMSILEALSAVSDSVSFT